MKPLLLLLIALSLPGCAAMLNPPPRHDPAFAPARPEVIMPPPNNTGAIYQPGFDVRLFEDGRARRVGDTLTVQLVENSNATKNANTKINKTANLSASAPVLMGMDLASVLGNSTMASLEASNAFDGKGSSNQSNALNGNITVTVIEVLPNGNLRVQGEKRLGLNQGNEYIKLSGIVRPIDIDTNNSVDSTRIADATMIYNGDGAIADGNRMGWLQRFFTSLLFPF